MKKLHELTNLIAIICIVILLCGFIIINYSKVETIVYSIDKVKHMNAVGNATTIDDDTLLELSTLDTLSLNFNKLPTITVDSAYSYVIEGQDGVNRERPQVTGDRVKQPIRSITFSGLPYDKAVDINVKARFENCGTLNDKTIDMVIEYSDFYSAAKYTGTDNYGVTRNNSRVLWWTAYGTIEEQIATNEWFQRGFESINMKIYFYYDGETTPIPLKLAYFTLYSEDGDKTHNEAASSSVADKAFVFENTTMAYKSSLTLGSKTYNNVYYGTENATNEEPKKAAISFLYRNVDCIDVDMHILNSFWSAGYHVNFSALSATLPANGEKTVSATDVNPGENITYTITQNMPSAVDSNFSLKSMVFKDQLNENLIYNSLQVYNEKGTNVTSTAGTTSVSNNLVTYTFKSSYLSSLTYTGQTYKFVISTTLADSPTIGKIENSAEVILNGTSSFTTNSVPTNVASYININYVDENGNEILDSKRVKGVLYDDYTTEAEEIDKYELITVPDNANGKYALEEAQITYVYKKIVKDIEIYINWDDGESETRPTNVIVTVKGLENEEPQVIEITTNDSWNYILKDLKKYNDDTGEEIIYTVTETTPEGYYISNETAQDDIYTITNSNYGTIIINKINNITKEGLQGAIFELYKQNDSSWDLINKFTSGEDGLVTINGLEHGSYKILEIKAPEGYNINDNEYSVNITGSENTFQVEIPNRESAILPDTGGNGTIKTLIIIGVSASFIGFRLLNQKHKTKVYKLKHKY